LFKDVKVKYSYTVNTQDCFCELCNLCKATVMINMKHYAA